MYTSNDPAMVLKIIPPYCSYLCSILSKTGLISRHVHLDFLFRVVGCSTSNYICSCPYRPILYILFCPLVHFSAACVTRLTRAGGSANAAASLASSPPTMSRFADDSGGIEIIADNDGGGIAYGREATKFAYRFFLLLFLITPRATGLSAFYTFTLLYNVFSRSVQNNSRYHYYCVADPDSPDPNILPKIRIRDRSSDPGPTLKLLN